MLLYGHYYFQTLPIPSSPTLSNSSLLFSLPSQPCRVILIHSLLQMPKASLHKSSRPSTRSVGDNVNSAKSSVGCTPLFTVSAIVQAWSRRRKHNQHDILVNLTVKKNPGIDLRQLEIFCLDDLQVATENFSHNNILGKGGFGTVYKGQLLDGSFVAVKRLRKEHNQGGELQFQTEVEMISRAIHRNLLRLRGFCMTATERLLVYPYMVNGSVASCLRERPESQPPLSWEIRKKIALGAARGLAYMHGDCNPKIIHRDVKASNILLDDEFEAVVGDLGLAKLMNFKDTHVTTNVRGTFGHIAPEYYQTGKSSEKTDNYGYGVMLLELISGRRIYDLMRSANDEDLSLITWVRRLLQEKKFDILVDSDLQGDFLVDEVEHLLQIALLCTRTSPMERPKMSEIVRLLSMPLLNSKRYLCDPYSKVATSPRSLSTSPLGSPSIPTRSQQTKTQSQVSNGPVAKDKPTYLGQLECFSLREIVKATDNFNATRILGTGAFGVVYKGELRGGQVVAIKRGKPKETKNQSGELQFQAEIEMIGKAVHRNLLRLLGFCVTSTERILVYPFMVNGSVASCLRGRTVVKPLPWEIRKKVAVGAAKGLTYLHDDCKPRIIHRDIKAANILLDEDFEAIVADFGLVKFLKPEDTHVTTDVRGTYGYVAPEYVYSSRSTVRTDVYGYGATLMELVSGKTPSALASEVSDDNITFTNWVEMVIKQKKWEILIDADLQGSYDEKEVERFIQVSLLCTQKFAKERPTMMEVLRMLDGDDHDLASRWEEWQKLLVEEKQADQISMSKVLSWITETVSKLPSEELSGPR